MNVVYGLFLDVYFKDYRKIITMNPRDVKTKKLINKPIAKELKVKEWQENDPRRKDGITDTLHWGY